MDYKTETEFVDYRRIFSDNFKENSKPEAPTHANNAKSRREKNFVKVFLAQSAICLIIICSILILKHAKPEAYQSVSAVLNGFYENNITLADLNELIDDKVMNNDTVAAFFNFKHD